MKPPYRALTLAIYPSSRGFGWVAFENPFTPFDWGIVWTRQRDKNARCLKRIERLLDRLCPETVVLETFEKQNSARRDRITNLGRAIVALAVVRNVDVSIIPFADVRTLFAHHGARNRHDIAEAIARQFMQFEVMTPRRPNKWDTDEAKQSLFNAAALAILHYQRDAQWLLSQL